MGLGLLLLVPPSIRTSYACGYVNFILPELLLCELVKLEITVLGFLYGKRRFIAIILDLVKVRRVNELVSVS